MKKVSTILMCFAVMLTMSLNIKAQDITITLNPRWTWISYPKAEVMDVATALGDFVPMEGDIIKSQYAFTVYENGSWSGNMQQFDPGLGYMYYSNRTAPISFVFGATIPQSQVLVTTSEPLLITAISAMGGGEVTSIDGTYIIAKGLCWAAHENPTTNDDFYQEAESGVGTFSISMTELNIATTYYVRAYAVTPNGTVYGNEKVFTTRDGIPTVTTADVTDILGDGATCGGDVTDNCGLSIIARGVCWSTSSNPTILESHTNDSTGMGSFISTITGLSVSTTYYVRAYATTIAGTAYGDVKTFTTCNGIPNVTTLEVTRVLLYTAACGGNVTEDGGLSIIARGVCWSTSPNPTVADPHTTNGTGTGVFSSWISGLSMNTTYYVRAYATNNIVTVYGNQLSFTTQNSSVGQYVDLGLPSGLLWATCNVGAETPEGAGEQFDYSLPTTYWGEWGENRRVPTKGEWQELCQNTTHTWITQNGTDGMLFTASNGNSLFLPIGGWIGEMPPEEEIEEGYYWSSSLDTSRPYYVWYFHFNMGGGYDMNSVTTEYGFRYFSVRLVSDHGYVDLGLPSGTLWATCNVGAEYPEDYGDYFAWGETQPKNVYNWSTYQYCNGSYNTLTKYCTNSSYGYNGFTDNLTLLLPEDDAATANWGADWRMPTEGEWQELYDNTTTTWTTQDGVFGRLFTASNGNSIFLPAAGYRSGSSLNDGTVDYWSNTLYQSTQSRAWEFYSVSDNSYMDDARRYLGLSVRAVRSASHIPTYTINVSSNSSIGGSITGGGTYQEGQTCTVTATANAGYAFTNWTEEGEVVSTEASYSFTVTGNRSLVANYAISSGNDHGYVDLGLPSGTLWATCNVGADTPEGYGDHFAWGETTPKSTYNWDTYQHCNGSARTLTKYCTNSSYGYNGFTDNLTTLLPEDDAATANWGEDWRMPVKEELEELYNNTTTTCTTQNGVYGTLFTATNGNSLFLPAEYRYSGELGDDPFGVYWSSSLNTDNPDDAWVLQNDWYWGDHMESDHGRAGVNSVRAVRSFSQDSSFVINVTAHPEEGGSVSGGGTYQTGTECTLTATPNEGYTFVCWMEYGYVATVSTEPTYSFMVNRSRNLRAVFCNYVSGAYHYVDLGLPSGLLWATCNVGAESPEDYGDYFAWGETQTKDNYSWSTYQHCNGGENTLTKYCKNSSYGYNGFTDGLTTLLPEDDAASVNWGLEWRMPTEQEWWELKRNTTNFLTTLNGVDGCLFIAANGNTLFLPKADRRSGNGFDEWIVGNGYCWSSSLCGYDSRQAECFEFGWDGFFSTWQGVEDDYRFYGQSVRAVRSAR